MDNVAFIDGQNLYISTSKSEQPWNIDFARFRVYLLKKYNIKIAYYFIGCQIESHNELYEHLSQSGFTLIFKRHSQKSTSSKKGNIDTDLVFHIMHLIYYKKIQGKIVIISGDGDYINMVDFLLCENFLLKMIFPNRRYASSLYKSLSNQYCVYLDDEDVKGKIGYKNRQNKKGALGS